MRWRLALGGCVLVAGIAAILVYVLRPGAETLTSSSFRLTYPSSWQVVAPAGLARLTGHPLAVLARKGGAGSVTITIDVPATRLDGPRLVKQVHADFTERLEDYRLLSAAMERTDAGAIFVYSYTPPDTRALHTVALVTAGSRSYLLSTIAGPGAAETETAKQIESIIRSFQPR